MGQIWKEGLMMKIKQEHIMIPAFFVLIYACCFVAGGAI